MKKTLNFLFEVMSTRFINRSWARFYTPEFENLAEHAYSVSWIALTLALLEQKGDPAKIAIMALLHDAGEIRASDADYVNREFMTRDEEGGMGRLLLNLEDNEKLKEFYEEYEKRESIESKIVKDADNLSVDFELYIQYKTKGNQLFLSKKNTRKYVYENKLYTETARKLWKAIHEEQVDPYRWITIESEKLIKR